MKQNNKLKNKNTTQNSWHQNRNNTKRKELCCLGCSVMCYSPSSVCTHLKSQLTPQFLSAVCSHNRITHNSTFKKRLHLQGYQKQWDWRIQHRTRGKQAATWE